MATALKLRRGTTAQHASFTGVEAELTVDTTKDTGVVHDGTTVGGFPLAREDLSNTISVAPTIAGSATASDDLFLIYDVSTGTTKKITRAELNNAIEIDALANVTITGGTINSTPIGGTTRADGKFTTLASNSTTVLDGTTIPTSKTLVVTSDIGTSVQAYDDTILKSAAIGVTVQAYDADLTTLGAGGAGARSFLGLGTAATTNATAYATAAQGAKADTALQSFTETDPIYVASSWYGTTNNSSNWNTAYSWGNHASAGYATTASLGSAAYTASTAYDAAGVGVAMSIALG